MAWMSRDIYAIVAERVREERKKAGLTMEQLAALAGISASFLAYIETRGSKPSLATVQKIADALGVPVGDMFRDVPRSSEGHEYAVARRFRLLVRDKAQDEQEAILDLVRSVTRRMRLSPRRR